MSEQRAIEADRDHWKAHAEEAGRGFERVCLDYARTAAAYSRLTREIESLAEQWDKTPARHFAAKELRALLATPPTTDRPADGDLGEGEEG